MGNVLLWHEHDCHNNVRNGDGGFVLRSVSFSHNLHGLT